MSAWIGLEHLDSAPDDEVLAILASVCTSRAWQREVADARPYADTDVLYGASADAVRALDDAGFTEALAGHPRIGERATGAHSAFSSSEQSGMAGADAQAADAMRAGNEAYEAKFGHVYLVCATGLTAEQLQAILAYRLDNDAETERRTALDELVKINRLRLARLVDPSASPGTT